MWKHPRIKIPKTKPDATTKGTIHYFTGKPCKHGHVNKRYTKTGVCIICARIHASGGDYKRKRIVDNLGNFLIHNARRRAVSRGLPCNLKRGDLVVPSNCPILGIPLFLSHGCVTDNTPSLDKIIPGEGYIKGNVMVISWRANQLKRNATLDELIRQGEFWKKWRKRNGGKAEKVEFD